MSETKSVQERVESENYGPGTPCSHCGEEIDEYAPQWVEYCHRHAVKRTEPLIIELKELADGWEYGRAAAAGTSGEEKIASEVKQCAKELRELIDEYE